MKVVTEMGGFYAWATPTHCLYRMTYEQLLIFWRQGWINQKMQALRLAGHMWGKDIDETLLNQEELPDSEEIVKKQFEAEFGIPYKEYQAMLPTI